MQFCASARRKRARCDATSSHELGGRATQFISAFWITNGPREKRGSKKCCVHASRTLQRSESRKSSKTYDRLLPLPDAAGVLYPNPTLILSISCGIAPQFHSSPALHHPNKSRVWSRSKYVGRGQNDEEC